MFGKPGAGKGTLSARLVKKYNVNFVSAGDLLRQNIADKTEIGRMAESIMASGGLLPDKVMAEVVTQQLDDMGSEPYILDGFPRTVAQGQLMDTHLRSRGDSLSLVVNLDVPDDIILQRISERWIHRPSGRIYNLSYNPPRVDGQDDVTGEPLTKRPDDTPEVFSRRLDSFYSSTSPLIKYYTSSKTTKFVTLSGHTSDEIWPKLEAVVLKYLPQKAGSAFPAGVHDLQSRNESADHMPGLS